MKKFLQITICIALTAMLCIGLSAQNERRGPDNNSQQQYSIPKDYNTDSRGPGSEVILTTKTSPYPAYKGTVANPFGSSIGNTGGAVQCLDYINGVLYGVRYLSSANQFGTVDPITGTFTTIKPNFHTQGSDAASIAYNPVDGKTYVFPWTSNDSGGPRFGTVDLATGDFTTIATWTDDGTKTYYAAIDEDGTCYALCNNSNKFGTIDLATGNFTQKATLAGITDVYYIQDLSFDRETGELYWVGSTNYNGTTTTNNHYWKIDKTTGALTDLGTNTLLPQGFSILNWYLPKDCPPVTNLNAEQNGMKAKITWNTPAEITDLTNYKIYNGETEIGSVPAGETTFTTGDLDAGDYTFGVEAIYSNGCVPQMVTTTLTIVAPLPPCEPVTEVSATYADGVITVTWKAPDVAPEKYFVYLKDGDEFDVETGTEHLFDVTELEPGDYKQEYCVLPVYAEGVCEGDAAEKCNEVSFTIIGIKNYTTSFSIVPNPATNNVTISAKGNFTNIEVLSFLGQVVLTQTNVGNNVTLDISNFPNGVYFVRITSETETSVKKFVKK